MSLTKTNYLLLSLLSGVLLALAWYVSPWFVFVAFAPLFYIHEKVCTPTLRKAFAYGIFYSLPAFLVWNALVTWWIWNSTSVGAVAAIVLNALFMSLVVGFWFTFSKYSKVRHKMLLACVFIAFWMCWEKLHLTWDLTWPWLNLGNVFGTAPNLVQWYEFTGPFGGTLWVLLTNFVICYNRGIFKKQPLAHILRSPSFYKIAAVLFVPILLSLTIYALRSGEEEQEATLETIALQQNVDPWEEQYTMSNFEHATNLMDLSNEVLTPNTRLIVAPESAIARTTSIENLLDTACYNKSQHMQAIDTLQKWVAENQLNFVFGLSTMQCYNSKATSTARHAQGNLYYDLFNTATLMNETGFVDFYHKCKLVPGVEKMPYPQLFSFLEKLVIELEGASGSLGTDTSQRAFVTQLLLKDGTPIKVGTPICYESIYGEVFAEFVKQGAHIMAIITNDSWWGNTPGHEQLFHFSKLRAIETRRWIARSSNPGISAFIDPLGKVYEQTEYDTKRAIIHPVYPRSELTFYTKYGDYLAYLAIAYLPVLLLYIFPLRKKNKKNIKI